MTIPPWLYCVKPQPRTRRTFAPRLEILEDLTLPATLLHTPLGGLDAGGGLVAGAARSARPERQAQHPNSTKGPALVSVTPLDNTTLLLRFNGKLSKSAANPASYSIPGLTILKATVQRNRRNVILTTSPQEARPYSVSVNGIRTQDGALVSALPRAMAVMGAPPAPAVVPLDTTPPRVVGAISTGNTRVVVSFSEPMADSALDPLNYSIVQTTVTEGAGLALVKSARFLGQDRTTVELTTSSQNELNYTVTVVNVQDQGGNPLAAAQLSPGGLKIDPTRATFQGTPPSGTQIVDSDSDGLPDNVELRGWQVTIKLVGGGTRSWHVTCDPFSADTDRDGFADNVEYQLGLDPRGADTDGDLLTDFQEYTEIFSDHLNQDTDGDGVDDGTEFLGVLSSPTLADTDGDGLSDGDEIASANRNPLVADLPKPSIEVGDINLSLDVRFTETTSTGTRQLESKTVSSSLTQSDNKKFSHTDSNTQEASTKLSAGTEFTIDPSLFGFIIGGGTEFDTTVGVEAGWTGSWTSSNTSESEQGTQRAYQDSLQTDAETTVGSTVERTVTGAKMQVTVFLKNASTMAFNIKNLQLTAFTYPPSDPTRLVPVATLLPENAPAEGFNLGPLVPERGPFIFANDSIFPSKVEQLMKSPSGLVFKISNFDITDEAGRNFAFASRDVTDRTTSVVIDYGGVDTDGDGEGDLTEYNRVAVGAGRIAIDTNGDGKVDDKDRRVVFDRAGVPVGITLRQALANMRLKEYDETVTPSSSLTDEQLQNSYSIVKDAASGYERIFRIRTVAREAGLAKAWELLTPTGIERPKTLDDVIMTPRSDVKLAFVQDLDGDRLPANLEYLYGTSDQSKDTDRDGLDDRFEALLGWRVDLGPLGSRQVFSSPTLADTDGDGLSDGEEAPENLVRNSDGLIIRAERSGPADIVTDPRSRDTDGDAVSDFEEVNGYDIRLRNPPPGSPAVINVKTNPANPDHDSDSVADGVERRLGGNPTDPTDRDRFADDDRDGLANIEESDGWDVTYYLVSTTGLNQGSAVTVHVTSDPHKADTDGDGIADGEERSRGLNPQSADSDGDGLSDSQEVRGFVLRDQGVIRTDPLDADTDNDKRSDGDEAELIDVESKAWIVRPVDKTPYRVYSNPLKADADFDGVVDGDEYGWNNGLYWSDPNNGNTDGDARDDGAEFARGTNPLVEDFQVTVFYTGITILADGDSGTNPGDYVFDLGLRLPDASKPAGLSSSFVSTLRVNAVLTAPLRVSLFGGVSALEDTLPQLPFGSPQTFGFKSANEVGIFMEVATGLNFSLMLPVEQRSVTFSMTKNDFFALEGVVGEIDDGLGITDTYVFLGGMDGVKAKEGTKDATRPIFKGSDLLSASSPIRDLAFTFLQTDNVSLGGDRIAGVVTASFIVS